MQADFVQQYFGAERQQMIAVVAGSLVHDSERRARTYRERIDAAIRELREDRTKH